MKTGKRRSRALAEAPETFLRGFMATALLSAFQDRALGGGPSQWRRIVRHGVQGGTALTAATIAAEAAITREMGAGLAALAIGAAVIVTAEAALQNPPTQETSLGQEEA